ncbi:MAG: L,D-transpeptidase [Polyangiaceae bacterium]
MSILKQALIAYEGTKPVYVTLVSTGADGLGDPKETHSTVRGQFLIHTKHVTATMSGDELGDEFYATCRTCSTSRRLRPPRGLLARLLRAPPQPRLREPVAARRVGSSTGRILRFPRAGTAH